MSVKLTLECCDKCPYMESERYYTADSWEHVMEWKCSHENDRRITLHETFDKDPAIPEWCPLRET